MPQNHNYVKTLTVFQNQGVLRTWIKVYFPYTHFSKRFNGVEHYKADDVEWSVTNILNQTKEYRTSYVYYRNWQYMTKSPYTDFK